jgi:hypothetical protein
MEYKAYGASEFKSKLMVLEGVYLICTT